MKTVRSLRAILLTSLAYFCATGVSFGAEVDVIEYYIPALNKYFITGRASEKSLLDSYPATYQRTGMSFKALTAADAPVGAQPICRFYLPPPSGPNSHTYLGVTDCATVRALKNPVFQDEGVDFAVYVPNASGVCPLAAPVAVSRSFNRRDNANDGGHRFTVGGLAYSAMAARGWGGEGPVFCSSQAVEPSSVGLPPIASTKPTIAPPLPFAATPGQVPMTMNYQALNGVLEFSGAQVVSATSTEVKLSGAVALRAGDVLMVNGTPVKVVSSQTVGGVTTASVTAAEIWEAFSEFNISGSADLSKAVAAAAFANGGDYLKAANASFQKTLTFDDGSKVEVSGSVKDLKIEESTYSYSASKTASPIKFRVVLTGTVETAVKANIRSNSAGLTATQTFPSGQGNVEFFAFAKNPGCITVVPPIGTLALSIDIPVCFQAELKGGAQGTFTYTQKVQSFRVVTELVNGKLVTNHTETPSSSGSFGDSVTATTELSAKLGVYVAPHVNLTALANTLKVFSARVRLGMEGSATLQVSPTLCTKADVVSVLALAYSAPVVEIFKREASPFETVFEVKSSPPIWAVNNCTIPDPPPPPPPGVQGPLVTLVYGFPSPILCVSDYPTEAAALLAAGGANTFLYPNSTKCPSLGYTVLFKVEGGLSFYVKPS